MPQARLSSKGQLVIPKEVREHLHVQAGDKIDFVVMADGQVVIRPSVMDVRDLEGILARPDGVSVSLEAMDAAVRTRASAR